MPFKLTLMSDVRSFLKGTADVEEALDGVAESLDKLADDTEKNADQAADALKTKFTGAFDKVKTESKDAGRKIGDDVTDGARKAGDGIDNFKDEGKQSIRETAASFSDVNDALDLVQEVAANAFVGFGPAGMAAGALAAVGIGLIKTSLDASKEKADNYIDTVHSLGAALRETGGIADTIAESMTDIVDEKEWYEFWQDLPIDRLTMMSKAVQDLGISHSDVFAAMAGDMEAYDRIQQTAMQNVTGANTEQTATFLEGLEQQGNAVNDAKRWNEEYADSTVAAHKRAEEASKEFSDALTDNLSVADEGLDNFVKDGKLNLDAWSKELQERAAETAAVKSFTVDIAPELSPQALENFAKLPTETQAQIAKAYREGDKGDKQTVVANLEAEAKVTKVTLDTSSVQAEAGKTPVEIPATVATSGAVKGAADAAAAGQAEANRKTNEIEFKTRIDRAELQRQVDRAAASIHPPTITIKTKVSKDQP